MYGWKGTVLRVDLLRNEVTEQPLDESVAKNFIGGRGLNSKTLFDAVKPGTDPLSPENVLCFAPGPLTGTPLGLTSRLEVSTLSPYSGILGDGNAGGSFATFLKWAGYDQIVITGRAGSPKYLWIDNGNVELRDARDLWGKTTWETDDILHRRHGERISVACIGQAGEHLVRFASTMVDKYASAARGSGAVWGSKNLKSIAVRGTGRVKLARPEEFRQLAREDREFFSKDRLQREVIAVYGTHIGMMYWHPGYRYFQKYLAADEIPDDLAPEAWKKYEIGRTGCFGCPVRCRDVYRIPDGRRSGEVGSALEFECIDCLGTNCGIQDPVAIMEMENLADMYGMCVIGLGNTIAFAKELYSRGVISREDTGGLSLDWDDADSQVELIHRIALREGFGDLVAEGLYSLAKITGKGAMDYCYHVKGLSRGTHKPGLFALAHATSTRGADHLRGRSWAYGENDADLFRMLVKIRMLPPQMSKNPVEGLTISERATTLTDSIGRCKGAVNSWVCAVPLVWKYPMWDGLAKLLSAATGIEFDEAKLVEAADRIYTLERAFNIRQGITRKHDGLPQKPDMKDTRQGEEELEKHEKMLTQYYRVHGSDPDTGIPTREWLEQMGLKYVADELDAHGTYAEWDGPPLWSVEKYPHGGTRA
ncbi:MAG: aldehyde ferredoxin oxidoreductase family protein [Candidatus Methanoperedens sp.]|nr:aldehyde ferredoxin oxidoreductase family protein [Candidatus Methanoperedens sp.]